MHQRGEVWSIVALTLALAAVPVATWAEDGYDLWLRYAPIESAPLRDAYRQAIAGVVVQQSAGTATIVSTELARGLRRLLGVEVPAWTSVSADGALVVGTATSPIVSALGWGSVLKSLGPEGFVIRHAQVGGKRALVVASVGDRGALYGTFHLLRLLSIGASIAQLDVREKPSHQLRLLNHWDNLDGSIERGYAGGSLWKWEELPATIDPRLHDYARANASLGLNGTVLNNVNANARSLTAEYIAKAAAIADTLRPYGLKVYLSANFAAPRTIGGLTTADPLDPAVRRWWKDKAGEIYRAIPDFGGFLVKANSEGQPGPQDYGRTHADGANMLADAVAAHGGIVMWRAFVYDASVDPDRIKRAYKEFVPLDGQFRRNVLVQTKNGPLDFMPREPYHPVFGAMPKTPNVVELQITQEYLGHATHLVYLAPMWKEFFTSDTFVKGAGSTVAKIADGTLQGHRLTGIAGVANTGSARNWTGHDFAAANWYAFGRLAWDSSRTSEAIAREWIEQTWSRTPATVTAIATLMLESREAFVNYTMPLGLHHLIGGDHYAVMPENDDQRRLDWSATYYHRADAKGVGFDRTRNGSGAVDQYARPNADRWNDPKTTPQNLLLWFHHLPWDYRLNSGETLWQGLVAHYSAGAAQAAVMESTWEALRGSVDAERHAAVAARLRQQALDAAAWRDKCLNYFRQYAVPADVPVARTDQNSLTAHAQLVEKARRGRIDVYFAGDSITRRWGATDYPDLLGHWRQQFFGWNAANFGWGGDTTQNMLWRLHNGELDDVHPRVIVLLAGTNNIGNVTGAVDVAGTAESVSRGIGAILDVMRRKAPKATIILTAIFPRNDSMAAMPVIDETNRRIARFADGRSIRFLNVNDALADAGGKLFDGMTGDRLHPTIKGYQVWADALKPILTELLGPPASEDYAPPPTGDPSASPARSQQPPSSQRVPATTSAFFGMVDDKPVRLYTLTNRNGLVAKITDYGAIVTELLVPDRTGRLADVVLGFEGLDAYARGHPYFGAVVGRVANRIGNAEFTLGGRPYPLAANDKPHHLHGGSKGWDKVVWSARAVDGPEGPALELTYVSRDGEEGYPGTVTARTVYTLTNGNELKVEMQATTDTTTLVNMAHHSYWNLAGHDSGTVLDHELTLYADRYTPGTPMVPDGRIVPVKNTPFDFTSAKPVGRELKQTGLTPAGYDHNFVVNGEPNRLRPVARLKDPKSGRVMTLSADRPGVQFYTGNFLDGSAKGKGAAYVQHAGLCLETQAFPNAINVPAWQDQVILRPGQTYGHVMVHKFDVEP